MNRKKITLLRYRSRYFIFKTDVIEFKPLDWKRGEILQLDLTNLARFGKMPGPVNSTSFGPPLKIFWLRFRCPK